MYPTFFLNISCILYYIITILFLYANICSFLILLEKNNNLCVESYLVSQKMDHKFPTLMELNMKIAPHDMYNISLRLYV